MSADDEDFVVFDQDKVGPAQIIRIRKTLIKKITFKFFFNNTELIFLSILRLISLYSNIQINI